MVYRQLDIAIYGRINEGNQSASSSKFLYPAGVIYSLKLMPYHCIRLHSRSFVSVCRQPTLQNGKLYSLERQRCRRTGPSSERCNNYEQVLVSQYGRFEFCDEHWPAHAELYGSAKMFGIWSHNAFTQVRFEKPLHRATEMKW